jgi:hypothetical protein
LVFNETARPVLPDSAGSWLDAGDEAVVDRVIRALDEVVPENGTSLENAFAALSDFSPKPDNLFLLVDGLPTIGETPSRSGKVSAEQRLKLFNRSIRKLDSAVPLNVILFPMEGDPMAASAYWQLTVATRGSFFSPSEDWP